MTYKNEYMISSAGLPLALLPISKNGAGPLAIMSQNEMHQTLQHHNHFIIFIL